jgi:hypothetical protein
MTEDIQSPKPQRGTAIVKHFGLRREAKRHAAFATVECASKAVSPLRSATAVQNLHSSIVICP